MAAKRARSKTFAKDDKAHQKKMKELRNKRPLKLKKGQLIAKRKAKPSKKA